MVNTQELIHIIAETLVNEITDAQAEDVCADGSQYNGYRERTFMTGVGPTNPRAPKVRCGSYFPKDLLTRYSKIDRTVIAMASGMVTYGVSTTKTERIIAQMGIDRMSSSRVLRICESLDGTVADIQTRDLSEMAVPCIRLDVTHIKCRDEAMSPHERWLRPSEREQTVSPPAWAERHRHRIPHGMTRLLALVRGTLGGRHPLRDE